MIFNAVNFKNINFLTTLFLISIIVISWVYTIFGIGMDMSAWKMTLMEYNQVFVSDNKTTMKDMKTYTFSNQYFISLFYVDFYDDCNDVTYSLSCFCDVQ